MKPEQNFYADNKSSERVKGSECELFSLATELSDMTIRLTCTWMEW